MLLALNSAGAAVLVQAADPTGLSTPLGKLVIAAGLLVVIVVLVRHLWEQRKR